MDGDPRSGSGRMVSTPPLAAGHHTSTLTITDSAGNGVTVGHDRAVMREDCGQPPSRRSSNRDAARAGQSP